MGCLTLTLPVQGHMSRWGQEAMEAQSGRSAVGRIMPILSTAIFTVGVPYSALYTPWLTGQGIMMVAHSSFNCCAMRLTPPPRPRFPRTHL